MGQVRSPRHGDSEPMVVSISVSCRVPAPPRGRADRGAGPCLSTLVLGALPIVQFGSEEQKQQWLPDVAGGKRILTAALSEVRVERSPDAGDPGRTPGRRLSPRRAQDQRAGVPSRPHTSWCRRASTMLARALLRRPGRRWRHARGSENLGRTAPRAARAGRRQRCRGRSPGLAR